LQFFTGAFAEFKHAKPPLFYCRARHGM
jgi:hypothetical protein